MKRTGFARTAVLIATAVALAACASGGSDLIIGSPDANVGTAEISSVYPRNVMPGTLVSISGVGFGPDAGVVYINGQGFNEFYHWSDEAIFFPFPAIEGEEFEIQVGFSIAEEFIYRAPEGSITVEWVVDAAAVEEIANASYVDDGLSAAPGWTPPLYIKGQWLKSGPGFGNKSGGWDNGSRTVMLNLPGTSLWVSETVFTPENMDSFKPGIMLFAFEDGDNETRNLSPFESDIAFVLKRAWAQTDPFNDVSSDPGVRISDTNPLYDAESGRITVTFPSED